ncbi:PREDICTED: uncharacterized protein LOC107337392 [Acropora digitifera]|uniref:uncharacterized protein LOC107337392 n=1 Tax=Acropora digitifera TaxID=70779 RepID=UPI00077A0D85|nr:PREDICTED: uncharacterized protein LOC107337392 [Acropora digitifera]
MNSATQIILLLAVFSQFRFTNACHGDDCRQLVFPAYLIRIGSRLFGHNVTIKLVQDIDECEWHCYQHPCCVSINFRTIPNTKKLHRCELNNATSKTFANNLVQQKGFIYREAESACESNTCENGAICQSGYTDKGYRCVCHSCFASSHAERAPKSCKDIRDKGVYHGDGEYWIDPANDGKHLKVFCDMTTDGVTVILCYLELLSFITAQVAYDYSFFHFFFRSAKSAIEKVQTHQQGLLRFIACTEIMLMPAVVLMMLRYVVLLLLVILNKLNLISGQNDINLLIFHFHYCRLLFSELRRSVEHLAGHPRCPSSVRSLVFKFTSFIANLAPAVTPVPPPQATS